ncbi:UDP-N-acetylmuramoyl-L-alanyl-D-glutamate--2,6-diaminopimelate ligase [bacterium]|nr:UDP-N-acetylmuramoyl-L-alanyl-D-glutamate--2,6-diaminopimelate ligase [bacterium]
MELDKLIENIDCEKINYTNLEITGLSYNSKTTEAGNIFIALVGENSDGHNYVKSAEENGAVALFTEHEVDSELPQIIVKSTRHQIADLADAFYQSPSKSINLIGVTGTNGKTTVTHLIQKIFENENKRCAIIGTLGYKLNSKDIYREAKFTTPQAPELQRLLHRIKNENHIDNIAMEVSSHSLEQRRVGNCDFKGAVLTNLTQDHLDYHITMDNYFDAKAILFKNLKEGHFAVINADDEYAKRFIDIIPQGVKILTYGIKNNADVMAENIDFTTDGARFTLKYNDVTVNVALHMNGMFSVYNVLAALTTAAAQGFEIKSAVKSLEDVKGVAGRFEIVHKKPMVIVDYAHTPDGLENVLKAGREITSKEGHLICLFGCGGDRDATKRPKMGAIAEKLADKVVVTSDNPRSENPEQIISDIMTGFQSVDSDKVIVESDRGKAIALLKNIAKEKDVVIVAGKGHEDYQILKDKTIHFDDREEVKKVFG